MKFDQKQLLERIAAMVPDMQDEAISLDSAAQFPVESFARLRDMGLLMATVPESQNGLGFGNEHAGAIALLQLFVLLGEGNLSIARLYEAHVNALQLIFRYGSDVLVRRSMQDAAAGHIFALWVTDPLGEEVELSFEQNGFVLKGSKAFCSGAGIATRALVTAMTETGTRMLIVSLEPHTRVAESYVKLSGMRAAITGSVDLRGLHVTSDDLLGEAGDYLREPVFSAGAWRAAAGALGGLQALLNQHRKEVVQRFRDEDPHQQARFGQLVMAYETARLWVEQAAIRACLEDDAMEAIVAYVNLARLAVEEACLNAMRLTQRSLGLSAFIAGGKAELICRNLATYLRQPAPDETLAKSSTHYFRAALPGFR